MDKVVGELTTESGRSVLVWFFFFSFTLYYRKKRFWGE